MGWEWIIALDMFSLYMVISQVLDGIFTCRFCKGSPLFRPMPYGNPTRSLASQPFLCGSFLILCAVFQTTSRGSLLNTWL